MLFKLIVNLFRRKLYNDHNILAIRFFIGPVYNYNNDKFIEHKGYIKGSKKESNGNLFRNVI